MQIFKLLCCCDHPAPEERIPLSVSYGTREITTTIVREQGPRSSEGNNPNRTPSGRSIRNVSFDDDSSERSASETDSDSDTTSVEPPTPLKAYITNFNEFRDFQEVVCKNPNAQSRYRICSYIVGALHSLGPLELNGKIEDYVTFCRGNKSDLRRNKKFKDVIEGAKNNLICLKNNNVLPSFVDENSGIFQMLAITLSFVNLTTVHECDINIAEFIKALPKEQKCHFLSSFFFLPIEPSMAYNSSLGAISLRALQKPMQTLATELSRADHIEEIYGILVDDAAKSIAYHLQFLLHYEAEQENGSKSLTSVVNKIAERLKPVLKVQGKSEVDFKKSIVFEGMLKLDEQSRKKALPYTKPFDTAPTLEAWQRHFPTKN